MKGVNGVKVGNGLKVVNRVTEVKVVKGVKVVNGVKWGEKGGSLDITQHLKLPKTGPLPP